MLNGGVETGTRLVLTQAVQVESVKNRRRPRFDSRIDAGFCAGRSGWLNCDFDLNGHVDFDDYALIDLAFNAQNGTLDPMVLLVQGEDVPQEDLQSPGLQRLQSQVDQLGSGILDHIDALLDDLDVA